MTSTRDNSDGLDAWALVEIMGHKRFAGRITEQVVAGQGFIRVDVPEVEADGEKVEAFTKIVGPSSIYSITPVSETVARAMAAMMRERPVQTWVPKLLTPKVTSEHNSARDDYDPEAPW